MRKRVTNRNVRYIVWEYPRRPSAFNTVLPLYRLLSRLRPDIVHCSSLDSYGGAYPSIAARLARVPVVVGTIHTSGGHPQRSPFDKLFARVADSCLDSAIAVSEACKSVAVRDRHLCADAIRVIHNGVPIPPETASTDGQSALEARRAVCVAAAGAMIPRKGFDIFLRAVAALKGLPELRFVLFGDGPERNNLEQMAQELGVTSAVTFAGWTDDMYGAMRSTDIFVLASRSEAFGLVAVEAMACGLPVVAATVGGVPEIVLDGETGFLVPSADPARLAEAIRFLAVNRQARDQMGSAGRERAVKYFSVERMVEQTVAYYLDLLGRR